MKGNCGLIQEKFKVVNLLQKKRRQPDPRVVRTRNMLKCALLELIGEKGYDSIRVQDIARRATLNRATFYLHYRDKDDLLNQSIEDILNELIRGMKNKRLSEEKITDRDGNVVKPLPDLVYVFEHVANNEFFYTVMLGPHGEQRLLFRLLEVFTDTLSERLSHTHLKPTVPKEILVHYAASAYLGVIVWWLKNGQPYPPEYMATQLTRLRLQHMNF